ncbi:uncharacterized protein LOC133176819 [Saccostrea echinata]|uniref:uncharacterized protein LOC133176819 n=1 Tax=Saccostrea echinata TaxID=191078 RepID=UPI002A8099C0|nr:uncharacterized protein LOC133176819 [Saccostrea echinata]
MDTFPLCVIATVLGADLGSTGEEKYYDCSVYSDKKDLPTKNVECAHDFVDDLFYCKSWECPPPDCPKDEQVTQSEESCPVCPDTCTTGDRIIKKGEYVTCFDGVNRCGCFSTGQGITTLMGTNKFDLCGAPPPSI